MTRAYPHRLLRYCLSLCLFYTAVCQSHFQPPTALPATDHDPDGLLPTLAHTLKDSMPFNYAGAPDARYSTGASKATASAPFNIDLITQYHSNTASGFYTPLQQMNDVYRNTYSSPHRPETAPAP